MASVWNGTCRRPLSSEPIDRFVDLSGIRQQTIGFVASPRYRLLLLADNSVWHPTKPVNFPAAVFTAAGFRPDTRCAYCRGPG